MSENKKKLLTIYAVLARIPKIAIRYAIMFFRECDWVYYDSNIRSVALLAG